MNSITDKESKEIKQTERNKIMKEIHEALEKEETEAILHKVEEVKKYKDDSRRMFQVVKQIQRRNEKK